MNSKSAGLLGQELAEIVKREVGKAVQPLNSSIQALEIEVRHGHERIRELETSGGGKE